MKKAILLIVCVMIITILSAQSDVNRNLGFEKITPGQKLPDKYFEWGGGYNLSIDSITKHSGKYSVLIQPSDARPSDAFGCIAYNIPAIYEGDTIELKAYIKMNEVKEGPIGLILRIDGPAGSLQFDNMEKKNIQGTADWKVYSVKLPYPKEAKSINFGAMLFGTGQIWVDDFQLLIDGVDISKAKLYEFKEDKEFSQWIINNAHEINTVDAETGFKDLQPFKNSLKGVRVVGLGEATHGTSEFFRMKHRMLEFLVKEMGFTSFYIEASMTRCRYINEYVLNGKGDLDTATAIQGFIPWRVEEVKNMIGWMRHYNAKVTDKKKVKFVGYDLQINSQGWKDLRDFYGKVNNQKASNLDSLKMMVDTAFKYVRKPDSNQKISGTSLLKDTYQKVLAVMNDIVLNEGKYEYLTSKNIYAENLMNIKLIVEEVETYKDYSTMSTIRDYYMAQNILYLLNQEKPETKVVVWAHNMHIAKSKTDYVKSMGSNLADVLKTDYYAIGFEFYSGSFLTRNMDIKNNISKIWDVMSVGTPPEGSLLWYYNKSGKDKFYIDFRNSGTDKIKNFSLPYEMHSFGATYRAGFPITYPSSLTYYDGTIYIKESTAAKSFSKVIL